MSKKFLIIFILSSFLFSCSPIYRLFNFIPSKKLHHINFDNNEANSNLRFIYPDTTDNKYLRRLRIEYGLDTMTNNLKNDFEKIKKILDWTHNQWVHSGNNKPSKSDPITILTEAKKGNNFRCVEYGIVSSAGLNSIGIPSRVLALKTIDVEKVKYGAGHVVAETYSKELQKWIFIDGQYNAIPILNNVPLNAVEFQKAIINNLDDLIIVNLKGIFDRNKKIEYIEWLGKYLFYFDIKFDNRYQIKNRIKIDGNSKLMLVPLNTKEPTVFQKKYKIENCLYTNNLNDFYKKPE